MRWSGQQVLEDGVGADAVLPGLHGLLRSVRTPEFAGTVFHEVEARSVLNRVPGNSPVPFRWTVNPYRGCAHACVYCLAGPTRVLLADGHTRPIAQLRVGDAVMGTERVHGRRRYVRTTVLAHWSTRKPAYAVRLAGGTEIVASGEHRFLTDGGWRHVAAGWCRAGRRPRLRPGTVLLGPGPTGPGSVGPEPGDPGQAGSGRAVPGRALTAAYRRGYLCGLVRADGPLAAFPSERLELEALGRAHHFLSEVGRRVRAVAAVAGPAGGAREPGRIPPPGGSAPILDAVRWPERPGADWCAGFLAGITDAAGSVECGELRIGPVTGPAVEPGAGGGLAAEEIVGRVAGALHRLGFRFAIDRVGAAGASRAVRVLGGPGMFLEFLRVVDPAVTRVRHLGGAAVTGSAALAVAEVRPLGRETAMYDITTGTGDFVAEGVVSHNCFARNTHTYLDMDAGADFDSRIVVKVNVARVLQRELASPRWNREPVAMGTNTDPYQRAEGRYRLMPGVISALARSGTPFSLLTKGTVLTRDLPALTAAAADVPVGLGVSLALTDRALQSRLEPGTPSPGARLDLVRRITDAGLSCGVMVAPVLPLLTDSAEALDDLLGRIAAAGATGASVLALHLRPGTREWFLAWLTREHPGLVATYERLYRRGAYVDPAYRRTLGERVAPLLRRHGLSGAITPLRGPDAGGSGGSGPPAEQSVPAGSGEQLSLL